MKFKESEQFMCGYLPLETANARFVEPNQKLTNQIYSKLSEEGFRRSGNYIYIPSCRSCAACVPVRLRIKDFNMRRRHRRTLKLNQDITILQVEPHFDSSYFDLYKEYQIRRHDSKLTSISPSEYMNFLASEWCQTIFIEFRLKNKLVAVSVFDRLNNSLSAVYTFYKVDLLQRSLGQLAILTQIDIATKNGLSHLYLGYWIENSAKMNYKNDYSPMEYFLNGVWADQHLQ
jgi:arginyl-tRNA--protein-N-Asp/Glu arginylyltransferase